MNGSETRMVGGGRGVRCVLSRKVGSRVDGGGGEIELSDCHQHLQATSTICWPTMPR